MNKSRILIVEDEAIVARDIERQLSDLGYEPMGPTAQGEQAIVLAREGRPDLVLMDIQLSGAMDGIAAAQIIREQFSVPVVFLTAFAEDDTLNRAKLAEPFGYVLKPFSERELRTVIEMALFKHESQQRLQQAEERLRLVLLGSTDAFWDRNLITNEIYYSARWWEMIGHVPGELPPTIELWRNLTHPDDVVRTTAFAREARESDVTHYELEFRLRHQDGHYVPVLSRAVIVRDASGQAIRVAGTNTDLTARIQAEARLRESELQLRTIIETEPECVKVTGPGGELLEINPAGLAMLEATSIHEVQRHGLATFVAPEYRAAFTRLHRRVMQGESGKLEFAITGLRGTRRWLETNAAPLRDATGQVTMSLCVTRDITEHKETEAALQHRADFLASLGQIVRDLLTHRDLDELLPVTAQHATRIFGARHANILIKEGDTLVTRATFGPASDHATTDALREAEGMELAWTAYSSGQPLQVQAQPSTAGSTPRYRDQGFGAVLHVPISLGRERLGVMGLIREKSSPPFSLEEVADARQLADYLALILHNAQLLAELREDVKRREKSDTKIKESEMRLASIIDSAMDAIITVDARHQVLIFNPAAEVMFRLSRAAALGQPLDRFIPPRFRPGHRENVENFGATGASTRAMGGPGTVKGLRADGEEFPVEASISQVKIAGEPLFTVILRDVTVRDRVEREKSAVESQLRQSQKLDAIGQLSGGIAHDFNNLLTAILGNTTLLEDEKQSPAARRELLQQISQAGNRAASLTRQLLLFSRREEPVWRELDLNQVVGEMLKMLRRILGENIELRVVFASHPQLVRADAGMLDQVLLNLTVNARDAMPTGGKLSIATETVSFKYDAATGEVTAWHGGALRTGPTRQVGRPATAVAGTLGLPQMSAGEFICLTVSDEGCGMTPDVIEHIFEPFFTTKEAGRGTGLGLATVYGIVQQHHGWIEVTSEPGAGTIFRVYLPRVATGPVSATLVPEPRSGSPGHGEMIMVVEDELSVSNLLRILLERSGYRVLVCPSGTAALALWPKYQAEIKLLMTDMVMPGNLNGLQLAQTFLESRPDLKVIIMSGYCPTLSEDRKTLPGGDVDFLSKPFELANVLTAVRAKLGTTRLAQN